MEFLLFFYLVARGGVFFGFMFFLDLEFKIVYSIIYGVDIFYWFWSLIIIYIIVYFKFFIVRSFIGKCLFYMFFGFIVVYFNLKNDIDDDECV